MHTGSAMLHSPRHCLPLLTPWKASTMNIIIVFNAHVQSCRHVTQQRSATYLTNTHTQLISTAQGTWPLGVFGWHKIPASWISLTSSAQNSTITTSEHAVRSLVVQSSLSSQPLQSKRLQQVLRIPYGLLFSGVYYMNFPFLRTSPF